MSRMKHKIKTEKPVASTSYSREKEHDLAYYIHDRVELMHQVFSVLKHKELKAMAPECVRHISIDDLQELCTEELLGISSKRLCAVLDGAAPPSDTESSSRSPSPPLETISLDSISSDEEILSQSSKKKKHKHRHRDSKSKSKKKKSKDPQEEEDAEKSKASRAGLTVLELLELQARARAIRAQLQQEQTAATTAAPAEPTRKSHSSDNEVEIKEEPPDVVEISSEDEKPDVKQLEKLTETQSRQVVQQPSPAADGKTVTKRINDLIITVPQAKPSRKIKLNRTKVNVSVSNVEKVEPQAVVVETKSKSKKKKKDKKKKVDKEGSDHDEITLQLSDSEKMDLLGSLEHKNFGAASTEDSESSSDSSEEEEEKNKEDKPSSKENKDNKDISQTIVTVKNSAETDGDKVTLTVEKDNAETNKINEINDSNAVSVSEIDSNTQESTTKKVFEDMAKDNENVDDLERAKDKLDDREKIQEVTKETIDVSRVEDIPLIEDAIKESGNAPETDVHCAPSQDDIATASVKTTVDREMSEGEVSDRNSSEVEAFEPPPEVVCISDDESGKKKKKKKDKKAKKEKKSKKNNPDFRNGADQNFYTDQRVEKDTTDIQAKEKEVVIECNEEKSINLDDDTCIILELSDDSSCYEVEGTVLSKEPTAEEIEALSAKIDEIDREEVVTDEQIREHERMLKEKEQVQEIENLSWKDRYLDSRKVKRVLSTANILNAMRKKNKELKKKLEESKTKEDKDVKEDDVIDKDILEKLEEGSIEHYNTLQGSTKFVDPLKEKETEDTDVENNAVKGKNSDEKVTKEMKKDAKQLLKMYKKLLKYNDMHKQKDPNKKKKKKKSKSKNVEDAAAM